MKKAIQTKGKEKLNNMVPIVVYPPVSCGTLKPMKSETNYLIAVNFIDARVKS